MALLSCRHNKAARRGPRTPRRTFGPWCASRRCASPLARPEVSHEASAASAARGSRACHARTIAASSGVADPATRASEDAFTRPSSSSLRRTRWARVVARPGSTPAGRRRCHSSGSPIALAVRAWLVMSPLLGSWPGRLSCRSKDARHRPARPTLATSSALESIHEDSAVLARRLAEAQLLRVSAVSIRSPCEEPGSRSDLTTERERHGSASTTRCGVLRRA